jgi:nucleoside-diphosphate-sugar epimerase
VNILVTGGLGFVGSHLVEELVRRAHNITVIDNLISESSSRENMVDGVTYWIEDIRNINSAKYVENCSFDVVFHLAALARIQPSFKDPSKYFSIDALGTSEVLEFARRANAKLVYAGSSSAYGGPMLNPYAFAKYTGEQLCEMYSKVYNMSTVIARFFNVYGPRQPISGPYATVVGVFEGQTIRGESITITGTGEQRRDFTHVSDIVKGLVALSEKSYEGAVFNLGTGKNYSINELAKMFNSDDIKYIPSRPGEAKDTLADIKMTQDATGWSPSSSLDQYVENFLKTQE